MPQRPTLLRELIAALALVFAGAVVVAAAGVALLLPYLDSPARAVLYIVVLLAADIAIFAAFGRYLLERRVFGPLRTMIAGAELIAEGDYGHRLPGGDTAEIARLADAVNTMTERLINHQLQLRENIRSLEGTNRELTEARDELVRIERMASAGRLSAGIAHEVGNPLGAIMGYLGLLGRNATPERQELAAAAEQEARRIDRIIRGLLDYSRPREVKPQPIEVNGWLRQTVELLQMQGRLGQIELAVQLAEELPPVVADPHRLQQVLVNLMLNATDAMAETPAPRLAVRTAAQVYEPREQLPSRRRDDPPGVDYSHRRRFHRAASIPRPEPFTPGGLLVAIVVADNGPGIPAEIRDQIFEPFVTTKAPGQGTGLGLAVAARLIDAMGGTVRVDTPPEGGAVFTVLLPAAESAVASVMP
jgi:two-component system, NtrC family, sensor kinase